MILTNGEITFGLSFSNPAAEMFISGHTHGLPRFALVRTHSPASNLRSDEGETSVRMQQRIVLQKKSPRKSEAIDRIRIGKRFIS